MHKRQREPGSVIMMVDTNHVMFTANFSASIILNRKPCTHTKLYY